MFESQYFTVCLSPGISVFDWPPVFYSFTEKGYEGVEGTEVGGGGGVEARWEEGVSEGLQAAERETRTASSSADHICL